VQVPLFPGSEPGRVVVTGTLQHPYVGDGTVDVTVADVPAALTLTATPPRLPASASVTLTAVVRDTLGQPVPQQPVTFRFPHTSAQAVQAETTVAGQAQTHFTCPAVPQVVTIEAQTGAVTDSIEVVCGAPAMITLQAAPPHMDAQSEAQSTITALVRDGAGQVVPGQVVHFGTTLGQVTPQQTVTDGQGQAHTVLRNPALLVGTAVITAQANTISQTQTVAVAAVPYQATGKTDTPGTAARLPALNTAYRVTRADPQATSDYYRLDLTRVITLTVAVRGIAAPADYDLHLLHGNRLITLGESRQSGQQDEQVTLVVPAGTYYVRVSGQKQAVPGTIPEYTLAIRAHPVQP
jgi:GH24 family phage-related lysozyme (muramidase)